MKKLKTIGVLGGMGPAASAETYKQIVQICQREFKATDDEDFPTIIVYSLPLAGFDYKGFSKNKSEIVYKQLLEAMKKLENAGAEICIIDCNTVHVFFDDLKQNLNTNIINLIETTTAHLTEKSITKVGVLCSNTSKRLRLYETSLEKVGIDTILISPKEQTLIDEAIFTVMGGTESHIEKDALSKIIERLFDDGAEAIVIGCTEISLLLKDRVDTNRYIDSQWLAIKKAVSHSYQK